MSIALLSDYLETYGGRDKFLRTLSYAAKLATIATESKEATEKCKIVSSQMSNCRVVLRLLDDIPMLHRAITRSGDKEPDWLVRAIELVQIALDFVYSPVERISWAGSQNIVSVDTNKWDVASALLWIITLHLGLIKSLRKLVNCNEYKFKLTETQRYKSETLKTIRNRQWNELLTCTRLIFDITYAFNYLPRGVLWGGYFKLWQVGALGTISSLLGLYQALSKQATKNKYS